MTVFEQVVIKLARAGHGIARQDPTFYSVDYDVFAHRVWDQQSMHGLPPEVFVRALKAAYVEVTGKSPPSPSSLETTE